MKRRFEHGATTVFVFQSAACILQLGNDLALGKRDGVQLHFEILDVLDQLNVLLREARFVRSDIDDGAIQFLDFHIQLGDRDLQFLDMLLRDDFLLVVGFDLREQLVDFGLEFGLVLFGSAKSQNDHEI